MVSTETPGEPRRGRGRPRKPKLSELAIKTAKVQQAKDALDKAMAEQRATQDRLYITLGKSFAALIKRHPEAAFREAGREWVKASVTHANDRELAAEYLPLEG